MSDIEITKKMNSAYAIFSNVVHHLVEKQEQTNFLIMWKLAIAAGITPSAHICLDGWWDC